MIDNDFFELFLIYSTNARISSTNARISSTNDQNSLTSLLKSLRMNELHPLTRARVYVQDLINGRWGDWWGYSNSQDMRTHAKESEPNRKMNALNWFYQIDLQHHLQHQVKACRLAERSNECINACASAH